MKCNTKTDFSTSIANWTAQIMRLVELHAKFYNYILANEWKSEMDRHWNDRSMHTRIRVEETARQRNEKRTKDTNALNIDCEWMKQVGKNRIAQKKNTVNIKWTLALASFCIRLLAQVCQLWFMKIWSEFAKIDVGERHFHSCIFMNEIYMRSLANANANKNTLHTVLSN